jgi:WD40 repeat protein
MWLSCIEAHKGRVRSVAFSKNLFLLASGAQDHMVKIWSVRGAEDKEPPTLANSFSDHISDVYGVCMSPDGTQVASASSDGTTIVWPSQPSRVQKRVFAGHVGPVLCIAWSPDGTMIATGGQDCTVRLWDAGGADGQVLSVCVCVCVCMYGSMIATGEQD